MDNAPSEDAPTPEELTEKEDILKFASDFCDSVMEKHPHSSPLLHKVIALTILSRLMDWHSQIGYDRCVAEDESGIGWLRDAGKLQAAMGALSEVHLGEHDFTND